MATSRCLDKLAEEKEQELLLLRQQQAQAAQEAFKGVENELLAERQHFSQLQADFDYNLTLLSQRDEELAHYEKAFAELKRVINNLLAENSELKVRVDGLHTEVEQGRQSQHQLKSHYVKRIEELHAQTDAYRRATQNEVERERTKLEELQRKLEQRLLEVDGEVQCQRDQISAEFDELSRQREHEHQLKVSELNSQLLSKESQVKQLEREVRMAQAARVSSNEQAKGKESEVTRMEREMRELQWKMEDASNCLESRVAELQSQLEQTQAVARSHQEDFQRRHEDLDRKVREKDACLKAAKEAFNKREAELERQLSETRAQVEGRESEIRKLLWEHEDTLKEKDLQLQRCQDDLLNQRSSNEEHVRGLSQEAVARDLKLQTLEDMCSKLREDVKKRDADIEHFKQEVGACLKREKGLEQSKAQLQLDWEARMEEVERKAYGKHQQIIQQLTEAKDKLSLECKEVRSALKEQTSQMMAIQQERDIAITTLNKHGLASQVADHVTDHMTLRQQNEELHGVIRQMRQELEQLAHLSETPRGIIHEQDGHAPPTSGYVQYMEKELIRMKSENRQLLERLQQTTPSGKPPTPTLSSGQRSPSPPRTSNSAQVGSGERRQHRGHLIALSDTIASLQKEKASLELSIVQLRSRVEELETDLNKEKEQVYLLKACQVPQSKLHLKLLQATKVIIALVKDKKHLATQLKDLRTVLEQRKVSPIVQHQSTNGTTDPPPKVQQCEKSIQTSRTSPHGHIQWMSQKPPESTMEERESTAHSEASCPPGVSNTCRSRQSLRSYGSNYKPCGERVQTSPRGEEHSTHQAQHQEEQQLDLSLASLKFTDSSLGESSLHHVLQMVERELSSSDNDRDAAPVRHSTPEPAVVSSPHKRGKENNERSLKLVGNRVVPQAKNPQRAQSQVVAWSNKVRTQNKTSVKPRVRNYNIKD